MHIKIPGRLWEFKEDGKGNEVGEFLEYKEDNEVYYDGYHFQRLKEIYLARQKAKWDNWIVYTGDEGDGKSTLAKQDCYVMAWLSGGTFDVNKIAWSPEAFAKLIDNSNVGDSVLYDEGITGMDSQRSMSEVNHTLKVKATMCRKKRLFVAICIPSLFDLQKNIAIRRSFGMVKVYTNRTERGFFVYYNSASKRKLYILGKKFEDMDCVKGASPSRFLRWSFLDETAYEKLKDEGHLLVNNLGIRDQKFMKQRDALIKSMFNKYKVDYKEIENSILEYTKFGLDESTIRKIINNYYEDSADESTYLAPVRGSKNILPMPEVSKNFQTEVID